MIYTFKVAPKSGPAQAEPLETVHQTHGVDVMGQARDLIRKHPDCAGVEVFLLQTRLFYLKNETTAAPGA
jgi:hypothetical protein